MPKQSPVPDDLDKPFWDACNEDRLIIQYCAACDRYQFPPERVCLECNSDAYEWREVEGRGHIYTYTVVFDTPVAVLQPDQPFNVALVTLDGAPSINMYSHLPGTPVDEVPIGAPVQLIFETTPGTGQKVPEWQVVR